MRPNASAAAAGDILRRAIDFATAVF
jgi:hypothetical protein